MHSPLDLLAMLLCTAICVRLLTYRRRPGTRYRPLYSIAAWALAFATGGQAIALALGPHGQTSVWHLGVLLVLAWGLFAARGNLAAVIRMET